MSETPRRAATLVLAAWEPEMAPLRTFLRSATGRGTVAVAAGIGAVDAAVGATRAIAVHRPARVIFVGTAGLYPGARVSIGLGDAAVAGELVLAATAVVRGEGYLPAPQISEAATAPDLRAALLAACAGDQPVRVACPTAITSSPTLARRIARACGAALENLEAFAVARAAAAAGVDFAAVLGVANWVGPAAHSEWRANHLAASRVSLPSGGRRAAFRRG